jgi:hypothetical protein
MPHDFVPKTVFSDKTANGLEKAICRFLVLKGAQAERVKTMGRMIDDRKRVSDVMGRSYTIGSTKYIPGTGTKGSSDIAATLPLTIAGLKIGLKVAIEVKIGADKMSEHQHKYKADIEASGGRYLMVKTFDDFYQQYVNLIAQFNSL